MVILDADLIKELPLDQAKEKRQLSAVSRDRGQIKALLWPKICCDISGSISGDDNIQVSRLDKQLPDRYVLFIRRAINEFQPLRVQILEISLRIEIMERLSGKRSRKSVGALPAQQ